VGQDFQGFKITAHSQITWAEIGGHRNRHVRYMSLYRVFLLYRQ
jgi:hypothetical protein